MIVSLIFTDFMVAFLVILWHLLHLFMEGSDSIDYMCQIFLPFPIYFFIAGYGWTVAVAWRFLSVSQYGSGGTPSTDANNTCVSKFFSFFQSTRKSGELPLPLWSVWVVSFICVLPMIILNTIGGQYDVTEVVSTPVSSGGKYCFFNSETWVGRLTNNICFQLPLLLTIATNVSAFTVGLKALKHSPHSVIAREMNRVGKYLFVLLVVWVPNLLVNFYQEITPRDKSNRYDVVIEIMVLLTSLQGVLNALVYAWGHKSFKRFVKGRWSLDSIGMKGLLLGARKNSPPDENSAVGIWETDLDDNLYAREEDGGGYIGPSPEDSWGSVMHNSTASPLAGSQRKNSSMCSAEDVRRASERRERFSASEKIIRFDPSLDEVQYYRRRDPSQLAARTPPVTTDSEDNSTTISIHTGSSSGTSSV
eukprot:CAMPEP_0185035164 /NCGR_PEP_ID=MMETSP1103-20130426/26037_1 /TAXON_ID=36769 /ORGANISM="Paraphysomonas bandaiensis, Strain Caron Lab Isolate" /LENGTH=418 /DNA_ID=CAMNT_0027572123 /DNA_START=135 /DNA_END=1391 /DNA_ORIENTATION=+